MEDVPTAHVFWRRSEATVERRVTGDVCLFSLSSRTSEVIMTASPPGAHPVAEDCPDLELGAHVARMRALGADLHAPERVVAPPAPLPVRVFAALASA
jgi:hypothetical protein